MFVEIKAIFQSFSNAQYLIKIFVRILKFVIANWSGESRTSMRKASHITRLNKTYRPTHLVLLVKFRDNARRFTVLSKIS